MNRVGISPHIQTGFTLFEIIIALSVLVLVAVLIINPLREFRNNQVITTESEQVLSLLQKAKTNTLSSKESSSYGVHFEENRAVLFKGDIFTEPAPSNEEVTLHPSVRIAQISLNGGGSDVVFSRLIGNVDAHGSVVIELSASISTSRTIVIEEGGSFTITQ